MIKEKEGLVILLWKFLFLPHHASIKEKEGWVILFVELPIAYVILKGKGKEINGRFGDF